MPQDLLFTKTHEWVRLSDDKQTASVGLTAFALELLTDLVHVELPEAGRRLKAGEPFGEIESVKAVSDLYSPVDGEVVEVNTAMADNLERLAQDPYENGWFIKVKLAGPVPAGLLDEAAYKKQCAEEQH